MKAASFLLLGAVFAAPTYAQCAGGPDALEDNDDCANAVAVPGNVATGLNVESTDLDFYTVTVADGEVLSVDITFIAANGDLDAYLWAPVAGCDSRIAGEGTANGSLAQGFSASDNENLTYANNSGSSQDLIIEVRIWSGDPALCNDYDIDIDISSLSACNTADALEDNDDCANAVAVPGNAATGLTVQQADLDFYSVSVADGEVFIADLSFLNATGDLDAYLWDPNVACDTRVAGEGGGFGELAFAASATDNEYLQYTNNTGATQNLVLEVRMFSGDVNPCNSYDLELRFEPALVIPALTANCVESFLTWNNGLGVGGTVYFDLNVTQPVTLTSAVLAYNLLEYGIPVDCEVYTTPGTHVGNEVNAAAWTLQTTSDGNAISAGQGDPSPVTFATPINLATGSHGIAIVYLGGGPLYTNGDGTNQTHVSGDGIMTLTGGVSSGGAFVGPLFTPRIFSGRLCRGGQAQIGSPFCMANPNSTNVPGLISATGSTAVADNNVSLNVDQIPPLQFGIFVVAPSAGSMTPVNSGILCLSGQIGRYDQAGFIWQADAGGSASRTIDLQAIPTPTAFVGTNPGDTWFFQAWHRDVPSGNSNFTTGVEITFN